MDIQKQKHYPFNFIQGDALEYLEACGYEYDFIHASPPCQRYSSITKTAGTQNNHPDLIDPVRQLLKKIGKPYAIENVPRSPLENPTILCGTMFGLYVIRHRLFETSFPMKTSKVCEHKLPSVKHGRPPKRFKEYAGVTGHFSDVRYGGWAMGITWMNQGELAEAVPPAFTKYVGQKFLEWSYYKTIIDLLKLGCVNGNFHQLCEQKLEQRQ